MRVYKRGRVWWCAYYTGAGERIRESTRCHDRKAAEAFAKGREREATHRAHPAAETATVNDALELLLQDRGGKATRGERSHATVEFYREKAGHWVRIFERGPDRQRVTFLLKNLRPSAIDRFIETRTKEHALSHTISKELTTLRASLKLAKRAGLFFGDIEALFPPGFSPAYKPKKRALTADEVDKLLVELRPDRAARVAFIVATSACWGETERALREHVAEDLGKVFIDGTKRASRRRTVPIVSSDQKRLLEYAMKNATGTEGRLFAPWDNVRRDLVRVAKRVGIERCSPNDLRRTCATWLHASGATPDLIAPLMGHVDSRMVERVYGRLSLEQLGDRLRGALEQHRSR